MSDYDPEAQTEQRPQIVYVAIVDRNGPLVQVGPLASHMKTVIGGIIEKMNFTLNIKKQFKPAQSTQGHTLQYIIEGGYGFISCAEPGLQHRVCMALLEDVKTEWQANQSKSNMKHYMAKRMDFYSNDPSADKIREIMSDVNDVKQIMHENLERVIQRGELLEVMEERSSELEKKTAMWEKSSKWLRWKELKKSYKCMMIGGCICCLVIFLSIAGVIATLL
eukprot:TRINITY_DN650_c0_g1_i5.p1 TRINITY_DN650_c0_g1~~TRINITY_DN650_c0_g1_i5.p1  ORF type:complete len:221 (-),score=39.17 TRINITY_DN650_c0_g1_i5:45-707(-)